MTTFIRLTNEPDKAIALEAALADEAHPLRFKTNAKSFELVPGAPICYWVSESIRSLFNTMPPFEAPDGRRTLSLRE